MGLHYAHHQHQNECVSGCVLSTLLYGSEAWTLYSSQEHRLNAFNLRCLSRMLGITWQDHVTNIDVLAKAGMPSMYAILTQRRLHWLGHVIRTDDGRIPKRYAVWGAGHWHQAYRTPIAAECLQA